MNHYETVFILNPVLSEEQIKETVQKFKKLLKDSKSKVVVEENWGLKKMAYSIQKKRTGFYYLMEFTSEDREIINKLELAYKRDERLMRWITVKLDKHALAYAERRRKRLNTNEKQEA
ncbi:MAG: 30S ribosomal protein S6 [Flavobacteriales bacterium]|jgi:small subunit ribosomal protein S6|nr:30S ribosomal protein S6 [Flavobacteriales bacterium]MBL6872989.1 30S ribosomal protein S6 [Flavobacteriales bacterium]MDB2362430.1 30S ribosomal protein S6 [Flavobacteriales bacterium]MDG1188908.1 30S ribosomal protein S6 [Flavobacteriales bacterium]|tara:strand:- start:442 stop:795 length:354 start_codon:yes stop_codon:yes gene_type:complete